MASPYKTVIKGGPPYIGKWPYNFQCPSGTYITKFNGRAGSQLDKIGIECSDGTTSLADGGNGGNAFQIDSQSKGFQSIMSTGFNGGGAYQSFNGNGYTGDNGRWYADVYQYRCPLDQYMTGIDGSTEGSVVKNLNATCDYKPSYCEKNLESPYCKWLMPQLKLSPAVKDQASFKNILGKACSINMSDTCRNNQSDLEPSTVEDWCKNNSGDPFCSCYLPVPSYIPSAIAGTPECWNNTCSLHGYNPRGQCKIGQVTICQQNISTQGNDNLSSNVIIRQDCKPTQVIVSPTVVSENPESVVSNNIPTAPDLSNSNYLLYLLMLVILVVVIVMFFDDDDEDELENFRSE